MARQTKKADNTAKIGQAGNNHMANRNGMDEIDLWAENIGLAERGKSSMTPKRKHLYSE